MQNAAIRLLGLGRKEIQKQAEDMIFGQLRQVIASMCIEDINRDREKFLENIQKSLEPELRKIGLILINVNITDLTDDSGYIEAIGRKAATQAIQKARGDVAENEKMGAIKVAQAEQEQVVQVANATKTREIGTREAIREQTVRLAELEKEQKIGQQTAEFERESQVKAAEREMKVRVAELEKEQKIGEQKAAFEREAQVKAAERDMRIKLAEADAQAVAGENEAKASIAASQAELQMKRAEAYQLGETKHLHLLLSPATVFLSRGSYAQIPPLSGDEDFGLVAGTDLTRLVSLQASPALNAAAAPSTCPAANTGKLLAQHQGSHSRRPRVSQRSRARLRPAAAWQIQPAGSRLPVHHLRRMQVAETRSFSLSPRSVASIIASFLDAHSL